jgi:hypothetical protein
MIYMYVVALTVDFSGMFWFRLNKTHHHDEYSTSSPLCFSDLYDKVGIRTSVLIRYIWVYGNVHRKCTCCKRHGKMFRTLQFKKKRFSLGTRSHAHTHTHSLVLDSHKGVRYAHLVQGRHYQAPVFIEIRR